MEQHDQERSWKSDPRLHHMDAKKIALLASFADELAAAPEAQRMNLFLDLHRKMRRPIWFFPARSGICSFPS